MPDQKAIAAKAMRLDRSIRPMAFHELFNARICACSTIRRAWNSSREVASSGRSR
jgi:hypothetical protein